MEVDHPKQGKLLQPNIFPKFNVDKDDAPGINWTGPALGAHNLTVYGDLLGLDHQELDKLAESNII